MRTWIKKLRQKFASTRGESISEVLIAMLIIELALLMVVSMIMSAGRMITKSEKTYDILYSRRNAMETNQAQTEESTSVSGRKSAAAPAPTSGSARVTVKNADGSGSSTIANVTTYTVNYQGSETTIGSFVRYEAAAAGSGGS